MDQSIRSNARTASRPERTEKARCLAVCQLTRNQLHEQLRDISVQLDRRLGSAPPATRVAIIDARHQAQRSVAEACERIDDLEIAGDDWTDLVFDADVAVEHATLAISGLLQRFG